MNRRFAAGVVLLSWVGALSWLVRREYWPEGADPLAEAAFTLPPGATYFAISLGGQQIGYASSTIDTLADTLRVTDVMALEIPVLGEIKRTNARTEAVLSRGLRLREFRAWLRSDGTRFTATGRVDGDSTLSVDFTAGSENEHHDVRLDRPIVLPSLMPLNIAFGGELAVGRSYALRIFDPLLLQDRDLTIEVSAESTFVLADSAVLDSASLRFVPVTFDTVRAWLLSPVGQTGALETWIDDLGQVVFATSPVGFTMERMAFEIAYENFRRAAGTVDAPRPRAPPPGDVIRQTAIASGVAFDADALGALRVRLGGVDLGRFDLDGDQQSVTGDTLTIRRPDDAQLSPSYRLPARAREFGTFLRSEPLLQVIDPRIRAQARQIVGRERRPRRVAEALTRWVYENIDKQVTASGPSAVAVLENRRGDSNEHTVLFVALARSVGLPARTAAGLVYLEGRFYYHAWPEVYLEGWVPVDPTFGQFPADASHIRFTIGGLARQVELIQLIGRLRVNVVDTGG